MILSKRRYQGAALAVAVLLSSGCAMIDRMTGEAAARPLRQTGIAAEAEILHVWDTGITLNDDPVVGLEVEVQPAEGEPFRAEIPRSVISRIAIPRFQPGGRIAVRYDPQNHSLVALDDPPFTGH
jgi:hypothetical protein